MNKKRTLKIFCIKLQVFRHVFDAKAKPALLCSIGFPNSKSRGTVTLKSADPHDPPLIDPNLLADEADMEDAISGKLIHPPITYFMKSVRIFVL